jgi:hypothetical protein
VCIVCRDAIVEYFELIEERREERIEIMWFSRAEAQR